jgi:hypothetical protein
MEEEGTLLDTIQLNLQHGTVSFDEIYRHSITFVSTELTETGVTH